jgi:tetratricopeptide (TPR) repeat protein
MTEQKPDYCAMVDDQKSLLERALAEDSLARVHGQQGHFNMAISFGKSASEAYQELIANGANQYKANAADMQNFLGFTFNKLGNFPAAIEHLEMALDAYMELIGDGYEQYGYDQGFIVCMLFDLKCTYFGSKTISTTYPIGGGPLQREIKISQGQINN